MPMNARLLRPRSAGTSLSDADATAYMTAVQQADGQALEPAVRLAIHSFVVGCKQDGIWTAIKACCLLMGARTLSGALTPLVGAAPTNNGPFVSGDYNRKLGLLGDGVGKYIDSNRSAIADPQDNAHLSLYVTGLTTPAATKGIIGAITGGSNRNGILLDTSNRILTAMRSALFTGTAGDYQDGFFGLSRSAAANYESRNNATQATRTATSNATSDIDYVVFSNSAIANYIAARVAFYSFGESLTLASLRSRVDTLYTAIGAAIP